MKNLTDFHKTEETDVDRHLLLLLLYSITKTRRNNHHLTTAKRTATEFKQTGYSTGYSFASLGIFMCQGCRTQGNKIT